MTTTQTETTEQIAPERADLLAMLGKHRYFLRHTVQGLTDEQAAQTPTVSELSLAGLIKHVAAVEKQWADFILEGPASMAGPSDGDYSDNDYSDIDYSDFADGFRMLPGETLAGLLAEYEQVAARTDDIVRTLPDLNLSHELPAAPWFPPGERWSARRVLMHITTETAQHSGHADIIRETIDGQKSMG